MKYLSGIVLPLLMIGFVFSGCSADSISSFTDGSEVSAFEKSDDGTHQKDDGTHQKDDGTHQKDGGTHQKTDGTHQ